MPLDFIYTGFENASPVNWEMDDKGIVHARRYLSRYCVYIMPMANKDGVARGYTRFYVMGKDLNRDWDRPADERVLSLGTADK